MLKELYQNQVRPKLQKELELKNPLAVPKITKVVINTGIGSVLKLPQSEKKLQEIVEDLSRITGQKPQIRKARKSIAGFKLRKDTPAGLKVTLRGTRMFDFLDRLILIALPRTRDFRGLSPSAIDKQGNLTIGVREHTVFAEIPAEEVRFPFGFSVTVVTDTSRDKAERLFRALGFPLRK